MRGIANADTNSDNGDQEENNVYNAFTSYLSQTSDHTVGSLLLSLPAQEQISVRKLQLAYESPVTPLGLSGMIEAASPLLLVRAAGADAEREIPQADLQWQLILPSGYSVRRALGTVDTDDIPPRKLAAAKLGRFLYELAGGIRPWYGVANYESAVAFSHAISSADSVSAESAKLVMPAAMIGCQHD